MRLRNQLLALSLLTLLLPWSGWKLVQELENFLREAEENTLLESAQMVARVLPHQYQTELKLARGQILPLRQFAIAPNLDGFIGDWSQVDQGLEFQSDDQKLKLKVLAGRYQGQFYLAMDVTDSAYVRATEFNTGTSDISQRAGLVLYLQTSRSQHGFMISTEAPGQLVLNAQGGTGLQLEAAWENKPEGYRVELILPVDTERISVGAVAPAISEQSISSERYAGTLNGRQQGEWLELVSRENEVAHWLSKTVSDKSRAWLLQADGWVLADSGAAAAAGDSELTWVARVIYQLVADSGMTTRATPPVWPVRFETDEINAAMQGEPAVLWSRDVASAAVYNLVAVPIIEKQGPVIGAVVLETRSEGLLLMTNRALGRFSLVALLLVLVLAAGLWVFASRLSGRVQRLSSSVSRAMDESGKVSELPLTQSADELGELARNTEKLLRAVTQYTNYLQKLAGRLSHELKTPIAITRSSLENLASHELDPQAKQYLIRAQEGLDRQAAIVRAMSEAQRLEGSVKTADWDTINLGHMLEHVVGAYRSVNPSRQINLQTPDDGCLLRCAPDLISQALDKLVDNAIGLSEVDCEITVSLEREAEQCLISVTNDGTRLPDVLHEQLFDSLVSLRDSGSSGQHLGLGLYIVRLVAEAHAGSVSAHNLQDGQGVIFTISIPIT